MKRLLLHTGCVPLLLLLLLPSCSWEKIEPTPPGPPDVQTRALTVTLNNDGDQDKQEDIHTVRFIVFDKASSGYPLLDVNELLSIEETQKTATGFQATLRVKVGDDKMVVAIINEPSTLKGKLDAVETISALEAQVFDFADVLNANHSALLDGQYMPMTGVKRGITVTESHTAQSPARTSMTVERVLARVDIYLKAAAGVTAVLFPASRISLLDTYDKGYLAVGTAADGTRYQTGSMAVNNFGRMLTVDASDLLDHDLPEGVLPQYATWSPLGTAVFTETSSIQRACSFYVLERTCTGIPDDKLKIRFENIMSNSILKTKTLALEAVTPSGGGSSQSLEIIKRNNVYEIIGTIKGNDITFDHLIVPWKDVEQGVIIDPQYYLKVSQDNVVLFGDGVWETVMAETNYDRSDRGFPAGIYLSSVKYYDQSGNLLDSGSYLRDWVEYSLIGTEGDLTLGVKAKVLNAYSFFEGCYVVFEFTAGNLTKQVKVTYSA